MKKILVIQNKRIGDVLISSVIAQTIKKQFPDSHITYFVYPYTAGVLENNPFIDRILKVDEKWLKKIPNLIRTIASIRREKYDIIFDPYAKFQSKMICLFSRAPYRIGFKRKHKKHKLPFYTHPINFLDHKTKICGKAIEDRINMVTSVFPVKTNDYEPKIHLTPTEKEYPKANGLSKPVLMLGVLGSTPQKSISYSTIVNLIDYITQHYNATILFNYAPHQKDEANKIYAMCAQKSQINMDLYEDSIRGFICLMNKCDMLIANEGGSVHIAKALHKPTFTIYSPYVDKNHWSSFEDGKKHQSIHLLEEKPNLFDEFTLDERRKIEANPNELYQKLTPEMIKEKLIPFLNIHFKQKSNT